MPFWRTTTPANPNDFRLLWAVQNGDTFKVQTLLHEGRANVNQRTPKGYSMVHLARNSAILCLLVDAGADIHAKTQQQGDTPLHLGVRSNDLILVETLLQSDRTIVDDTNNEGQTALFSAVLTSNAIMVQRLIRAGADSNVTDKDGFTPLTLAASRSKVDFVAKLLKDFGFHVNEKGPFGKTALHFAYDSNNIEMAKLLSECGANLNIPDCRGNMPLHIACIVGNYDMAKLLVEYKAELNVPNHEGNTPLMALLTECSSCQHKAHTEMGFLVLSLLLQHGSWTNVWNRQGLAPLHQATKCGYGFVRTMFALLGHEVDVNINGRGIHQGTTCLHLTAKSLETPTVRILLDRLSMGSGKGNSACLVHSKDSDGRTPLHVAMREHLKRVQCGEDSEASFEAMRLLLKSGAAIDCRDCQRSTPLSLACETRNIDTIYLLLRSSPLSCSVILGFSAHLSPHEVPVTASSKKNVSLFSMDASKWKFWY